MPAKKKQKIRPIADRIAVKVIEQEEKTAGGIIIPSDIAASSKNFKEGEVIAVGSGRLDDKGVRHPVDVQVGDTVVFPKYAGAEVEVHGEKLTILLEKDILATRAVKK